MKERLEASYKNLDRAIDWIKNADTKASIIIAFNGTLLGFLFSKEALIKKLILMEGYAIVSVILAILLSALALSLYNAVRVILPDISVRPNTRNLFFFNSISAMSLRTFRSRVRDLSEEEILENLIVQTYVNSQIANRKFFHLKRAWTFLAVALTVGPLLGLVLVILS